MYMVIYILYLNEKINSNRYKNKIIIKWIKSEIKTKRNKKI